MSWWNPLDYLPLGSDGSSVNDLERGAQSVDERIAAENKRRADTGYWTPEEYERAETARMNNQTNVSGEVYRAAGEGAVEGLTALPDHVRGALNTSFNWSLSFIPWWGWVGLLVAGFWYLGGFVMLRGILSKK